MTHGAGNTIIRGAPACAALALCLALTGCGGKPKNFENDNDALRRRVTELEGERDAALARAIEAETKLSQAALARDTLLEGQSLEALPRCAGVTIDRFSGLADANNDGADDTVEVYVRPFDGRQRFVQVAGRLTAEATILPPASEAPSRRDAPPPTAAPDPVAVGPVTLSPVEMREAYRSSLLGTHYLVELPFPRGAAPQGSSVVIRVTLLDSTTGVEHRAERLFSGR